MDSFLSCFGSFRNRSVIYSWSYFISFSSSIYVFSRKHELSCVWALFYSSRAYVSFFSLFIHIFFSLYHLTSGLAVSSCPCVYSVSESGNNLSINKGKINILCFIFFLFHCLCSPGLATAARFGYASLRSLYVFSKQLEHFP